MNAWGIVVICCSYILGLLSTGLIVGPWDRPVPLASYGVLIAGLLASWFLPKFWRLGPTRRQWIIGGVVGLLGAAYCVARIPHPAVDDISQFAAPFDQASLYSVVGEVESFPQMTRSGKGKFWLQVEAVQDKSEDAQFVTRQPASGKLYVTVRLDQVKGLYPGQTIKASGQLYAPSTAEKPGEFDFKQYLASQGCFAGLSAKFIDQIPTEETHWGLWQLRQRIVLAHGRWLVDPQGPLVSAMTLGRRAVDLPFEIRDAFIEAGLAHTLAASGFHVALVLGLVLALLRSQLPRTQAIGGSLALLTYVGLTGLQPSVMRAAIMGFGALIGLAMERKVKPLGCLLVAITLLLLWNPRWIWDIGFQLSVMATLGLIVTTQGLVQKLDWLPVAIASLIAVPLAAYLWTVPLQLYHFGVLPAYSILLNILATPLVTIISLGGFISAIAALIWPLIGSAIAWLLAIPIQILIGLVNFFNALPGHQIQVGHIPAWLVVISYGLYAVTTLWLAHRQKAASV
jgi:competence protein ComEC